MSIKPNQTIEINGILYDYHVSDIGMMIERDGVQYSEAIDPLGSKREYTETDIPIESDEVDPETALTEILEVIGSDSEVTL